MFWPTQKDTERHRENSLVSRDLRSTRSIQTESFTFSGGEIPEKDQRAFGPRKLRAQKTQKKVLNSHHKEPSQGL